MMASKVFYRREKSLYKFVREIYSSRNKSFFFLTLIILIIPKFHQLLNNQSILIKNYDNLCPRQEYFLAPIDGKYPAPDSASTATAISTGYKTNKGNISWAEKDIENGELKTITEYLKGDLGFSVGIISSVPFSHATPAAFISHNTDRFNYYEIAYEIIYRSKPEVIIGGGYPHENYTFISPEEFSALENHKTDYVFVGKENGVNANIALGNAAFTIDLSKGEKLFGLFGDSGGNFGFYHVQDSPGEPSILRHDDEDPDLSGAMLAALSVLSQDPDGFFLMIEQGEIDWANHDNNFRNMIGVINDLNNAVSDLENFINQYDDAIDWSNTFIIITSDHANSYMRLLSDLASGDLPKQVLTSSGYDYPDDEVVYRTNRHTNELVTLSAHGAGAQIFLEEVGKHYPETKIIDNTQINKIMKRAVREEGVKNIILFIGDGMQLAHEVAASRYLFGIDKGLRWHLWPDLINGWGGYATTWDIDTYNLFAAINNKLPYQPASFNPLIGYDIELGGKEPYPILPDQTCLHFFPLINNSH